MLESLLRSAGVVLCLGAAASCTESVPGETEAPTVFGCEDCTVLAGGRVFDGAQLRPGALSIRDGRIAQVSYGEVAATKGEVVDLQGRAVLPGLIDLHVHTDMSAGPFLYSSPESLVKAHLQAMLRAGVTTYLDLGAAPHMIFTLRSRIEAGELTGPNVAAAGPFFTGPGGHPCPEGVPPGDRCHLVDSVEAVGEAWAALAPWKPDAVKGVVGDLSPEVLGALAAAGAEANIPVIVHLIHAEEMARALDAGIRSFAHVASADLMPDEVVQRLAAEGAALVPTLIAFENVHRIAHGQLASLQDPALGDDVPASVSAALSDPAKLGYMTSDAYKAVTEAYRANSVENFKRCLAAGVKILAGSDAGIPGTFHGRALKEELALYVAYGMSPVEAIRSATVNAADFLGRGDLGRLAEGAVADVLVVDGDPLDDIAALDRVAFVFKGGARLDREALALPGGSLPAKGPTGIAQDGDTCFGDAECAAELRCVPSSHLCRSSCTVGALSSCTVGSSCFVHPQGGGYCYPSDHCDVLEQDCANQSACMWVGNSASVCLPAGDGQQGEPCPSFDCAPGFQCDFFTSECVRICDPEGAGVCADGEQCVDQSQLAGLTVGSCL